ncbi:MAG: beta-ketoacyl synthase N-terminal-like domain-containing protein, partial [Burkholderiaceae bacterium]
MSTKEEYASEEHDDYDDVNNDIAIIGMAGRFPMADSVDEFWTNIVSSRDCITRFSLDELAKMGVAPAALADPHFVPAGGFIPDQDKFDAHFFEMNPREAANLDPQHRFALEVTWQTLEHAGYTPESVNGSIGVFAGVNMSTYFIFNLLKGDEATSGGDALDTQISVDKDMFASRISYKLNLNGPSVALGTACSTSLVCIHLACQSLLNGESKMALAGGSHLATPNCTGHIYHQGGYSSPDGYCRAFDAKGKGTVGGAGTCFVLLKRLDDALADNDTIYAVIKGSAVNNDGSEKIGYTAPSIVGQTNIIAEAQAVAGV